MNTATAREQAEKLAAQKEYEAKSELNQGQTVGYGEINKSRCPIARLKRNRDELITTLERINRQIKVLKDNPGIVDYLKDFEY